MALLVFLFLEYWKARRLWCFLLILVATTCLLD